MHNDETTACPGADTGFLEGGAHTKHMCKMLVTPLNIKPHPNCHLWLVANCKNVPIRCAKQIGYQC